MKNESILERINPTRVVDIIHPTNPMQFYYIGLTERGEYWIESEAGEGMLVTRMKMYELLDEFFKKEF